jgi:transcriptional regulator with XRE-family HTH domain
MAKRGRRRKPIAQAQFDVYGFRKRLGLTQAEFAKLVGTNPRTIGRWELEPTKIHRYFLRELRRIEAARFGATPDSPAVTQAPRPPMQAAAAPVRASFTPL